MEELIAQILEKKDWENTSLGPPASWPSLLRTMIKVMLSSKFPMFLFWGPEFISFYNDAFRPSLGRNGKHPEILGIPGNLAWAEIWSTIKPLLDQALNGKPVWREDMLVPLFRNGSLEDAYWTFSYSAVYHENGEASGVLVICQETTEKMHATKAIEYSQNKFRNIISQAPIGIAILKGHALNYEVVNERYLDIINRNEAEVIGKSFFDVSPELRHHVQDRLQNVMLTGKAYYGTEFKLALNRRGVSEDGYFSFVYHPLLNQNGDVDGVIVAASEVTSQVRQKIKVQEREKKTIGFLMNSPVPMCILVGPEFIIETVNAAMVEGMWKKQRADVIGKKLFDLFPELKSQKFFHQINEVYRTGIVCREKEATGFILVDNELTKYVMDYEYTPLIGETGQTWGVMTTIFDVTEKVEAREKVEKAMQTLQVIIEASELGTWTLDLITQKIEYSEQFGKILGIPSNLKLNRDEIDALIHPSDIQIREAAYENAFITGNLTYVARIGRDQSDTRWIEKKGKLFYTPDGTPEKFIGTLGDITDEKRFQEFLEDKVALRTKELEQKNRELERINTELKTFAFISSHDLQEPLRKIQLLSSRIIEAENLTEKGKYVFERIIASANRMQLLLKDLLMHSQVSESKPTFHRLELKEIVDDLRVDFHDALKDRNGTLDLVNSIELRVIPHQFKQLLFNLISNSLKFSRAGVSPKIEISVEKHIFPLNIPQRTNQMSAAFNCIRVADNGIGFDPAYNTQIFNVFKRLHGNDHYTGTGIGLAIVKRIAENHRGFVEATGENGKGAKFEIYLPEADQPE